MAVHKVPQDVEAEDKLIGPLSFREFIYALIAVGGVFLSVLLFRLSPFLVVIPVPVVILFGAIALPLRKDQPMEIYLLAIVRFLLRPHLRLWVPDGIDTLIEIDSPKQTDAPLLHTLTSEAAERRLEYLSQIMDSRGWSFKHVTRPAGASVSPELVNEAANATDVMDEHADLAKNFDKLLTKKNEEQRKVTLENMRQAATQPASVPAPSPFETALKAAASSEPRAETEPNLRFNPYPTIHQKVVQPFGATATVAPSAVSAPAQPQPPSPTISKVTPPVSPGIMRLAHNDDLSISAIAREAHRLQGDEEVVITLH
ncbi:MAG TPA: PrgI family protein [Candidatus Acidoferrum sp.]|nr:PrgI family protein [Candidatus Acidoferrum sp.]